MTPWVTQREMPAPGMAPGMRNLPNFPGRRGGRELLIVWQHKAPDLAETPRDREVSHRPAGRFHPSLPRPTRPAETNPARPTEMRERGGLARHQSEGGRPARKHRAPDRQDLTVDVEPAAGRQVELRARTA